MTDPLRVSRLDAAHRQLNLAIRLLFASADPVAVHTLAGAAATLLKNALDQNDKRLAPPEYFRMMHKTQHALDPNTDPSALFEVDPADTEALLFWAVMNASELGALSLEQQLYQRWYVASHLLRDDEYEGVLSVALQDFGDLSLKSHCEQLQAGARSLAEFEASGPSDSNHWKTQCDYK